MDELELVVEHTAFDEWMRAGFVQPFEEIIHQFRNLRGRRPNVDCLARSVEYAYLPRAKRASAIDQPSHHQLMDFEEVFHLVGVDTFYRLVCRRRTQNLAYLFFRSDNLLSFENRRHLIFGEGVALDSGRAAN